MVLRKPDCIDCHFLKTTRFKGLVRCKFGILDGLKKQNDGALFGNACDLFDYEFDSRFPC